MIWECRCAISLTGSGLRVLRDQQGAPQYLSTALKKESTSFLGTWQLYLGPGTTTTGQCAWWAT
jgi:hypothetical protein